MCNTLVSYFYCKECNKYINEYYFLHDIGGVYYLCKCGKEICPIYPNMKELRKIKLQKINEHKNG